MKNRTNAYKDYRYGFNGKEKNDDVYGSGNNYDFGARIYDPRLGRFLSLDPDAAKYVDLSPYCFAANDPIRLVDVDGRGPGDKAKGFADALLEYSIGFGVFHYRGTSDYENADDYNAGLALADAFVIALAVAEISAGAGGTGAAGAIAVGSAPALVTGVGTVPALIAEGTAVIIAGVSVLVTGHGAIYLEMAQNNQARQTGYAESGSVRKDSKTYSKAEIKAARQKGVSSAWKREAEAARNGGKTSRNWSESELTQLKEKGKVDGYAGHHKKPVSEYPELAADPNNIEFLQTGSKSGGARKGSEHYNAHNPPK